MRPAWIILGLSMLATGCGPTDEEVGRAVMLSSPFAFVVGLGLTLVLAHLWHGIRPAIEVNWRPILIGQGICAGLAVLALVGVTEKPGTDSAQSTTSAIAGVLDLVGIAFVVFGGALLASWLVSFRLWLGWRPGSAFSHSWVPPLVLLIWPCPIMAFGATQGFQDVFLPIWIYAGYLGIVPSVLFLGLLTEVLIRRSKAKRAEGA